MNLTVRKFNPDFDLDHWAVWYADPETRAMLDAPPAERLQEYLRAHAVYTVWDGVVPVGGFVLGPSDDSNTMAYLATMIVAPNFRREGIARRMIPMIRAAAKDLGYGCVCASVFVDNPAAIRLLQEAGLREGRWFAGNL